LRKNQDIDEQLRAWPYKPGIAQARVAQGRDGREVLQLRVDLGMLQLETVGRPDGSSPHGFANYLEYLQAQELRARKADRPFVMSEENCQEADREFVQYYHRRACWLALRKYRRAMADADHTLAFMDFVRAHSPSEEFTEAHEQYRGLVVFQRTQAAAALRVEGDDPEGAIDEVRSGLTQMRAFFLEHEAEEQMDEDAMVQHLRKIEQSLRDEHGISATLREQLDQAVANENYEEAAKLRDALRRRE
jgi:UvrB/UvrC motif-containing protein